MSEFCCMERGLVTVSFPVHFISFCMRIMADYISQIFIKIFLKPLFTEIEKNNYFSI